VGFLLFPLVSGMHSGFEQSGRRSTGPAESGPSLRVFSGGHGIGPVFACFFDLIGSRGRPCAMLFHDPVGMTSITRCFRYRLVTFSRPVRSADTHCPVST